MIKKVNITNFGPIKNLDFKPSPNINLIIGENDTGKTFILKIIYCVTRAIEEYKRGKDTRSFKQVLDDKLTWTFQVEKLGELVRKGQSGRLVTEILIDDFHIKFSFSSSAIKGVGEISEVSKNRDSNSIFIPAKEVLSLTSVIKKSRNLDKEFGFDDTYLDLVNALEKKTTKGKNREKFSSARKELEVLTKGTELDQENDSWIIKKGNFVFPIQTTAEGIKKIAILDRLLGNRTLSPNSILFIDEPEAVLHPKAIVHLMEIISLLAQQGIQIFMATHSFFVIKKMQILVSQGKIQSSILSIKEGFDIEISNLKYGLPKNPIIETSIALYEEEVKATLGL
jgi:AAA15 family ATPase/GTPase